MSGSKKVSVGERIIIKSGKPMGFYDIGRKEYLVKNGQGIWIPLTESQFKRHLRKNRITNKIAEGELLSPAEIVIEDLIENHTVDYYGALSGRTEGFYDENGIRFLVSKSVKIPEAKEGAFPLIDAIIAGLFGGGDYGDTQIETLWGWLHIAANSLNDGERSFGQFLALAGEVDCGKSFFQKIITELLGGRSAKAAHFLSGKTPFNGELFGAEHLILEDESMVPDFRVRRSLGEAIKNAVANEVHGCYRKGREGVNLKPWWRLSLSVNDDAEALAVLPPLDGDIADKIILLHARRFKMPMPSETHTEKREFWDAIKAEIPAFFHAAINHQIPDGKRCRRWGIKSWLNPELVEKLNGLSPEMALYHLIEESGTSPFTGTADELRRKLAEDTAFKDDVRRLLGGFHGSCGKYLNPLSHRFPKQFKPHRTKTRREWIIDITEEGDLP